VHAERCYADINGADASEGGDGRSYSRPARAVVAHLSRASLVTLLFVGCHALLVYLVTRVFLVFHALLVQLMLKALVSRVACLSSRAAILWEPAHAHHLLLCHTRTTYSSAAIATPELNHAR
jgi:hypothetical protein